MALSAEDVVEIELLDAIRLAVGLEELRAGRHILRDAQRRKLGERFVRKLWLARVQTPAAPPACLTCLVSDSGITLALAAPKNLEDSTLVTSVLEFDRNWEDPMVSAITSLDPWSCDNRISLTGCSYRLFLDNSQAQAMMRFSGPRDFHRLALQSALFDVASLFVLEGSDAKNAVKGFLDRWESEFCTAAPIGLQERESDLAVVDNLNLLAKVNDGLRRIQGVAPSTIKKGPPKKNKSYTLSKPSIKRGRKKHPQK